LVAEKYFELVFRQFSNPFVKVMCVLQGTMRAAFRMKFIDDKVRGHKMWVPHANGRVFVWGLRCSIFIGFVLVNVLIALPLPHHHFSCVQVLFENGEEDRGPVISCAIRKGACCQPHHAVSIAFRTRSMCEYASCLF
jgi:hypothetical protein